MKPDHRNIDDLFRDGLGQDPASGKDWDVPSDQVWQGIESELPSRRRRRGLWWLFPAVFLVLAALSIYVATGTDVPADLPADDVISHVGQDDSAGSAMVDHASTNVNDRGVAADPHDPKKDSHAIVEPMDDLDTEAPGGVAEMTAAKTADPVSQDNAVRKLQDSRNAQIPERKSSDNSGSAFIADDNNRSDDNAGQARIVTVEPADKTGTSHNQMPATLPNDPGVTALDLTEKRDVSKIAFLDSEDMPLIWTVERMRVVLPAVTPAQELCESDWGISGFIAPSLGTRRITVSKARPHALRDRLIQQERPVAQLGFGISIDGMLNHKWSVSGGIEYNSYAVEISGRHQVRFTRFGERLNDRGNIENTLDLNLNTSYGNLDADVIIERSPTSTIEEHRFINLDLEARQSMKVLQVPVSLKRHIPLGGVIASVQGGLSGNILIQDRFESTIVRSTHIDVVNVRVADKQNISGTRKLALGYQFGLGIEKALNCHWAVILEPTLSGFIQPVYQNDAVSVYPTQFDVHVGVQYKW